MKAPVPKLIEVTGTSTAFIKDAVEAAIKSADQIMKNSQIHSWPLTFKVVFSVKN
jgi:flavin-binding protein dodecin